MDLFEKFFKHYSKKQWNLEPSELSPSVCGRIPIRTNDDCRYFTDKYQFMPKYGYTKMFEKILNHKNIEVILNTDYKSILDSVKFDKMIYTGPMDYFFDYKFGKLPHRSIKFEFKNFEKDEMQDSAVYNYTGNEVEYTRVTEYKHLTSQKSKSTTLSFEYSIKNGDPFYPIPNENNRSIYLQYRSEAEKLNNVIFCGRLAEYQYYNMDQVVANTLKLSKNL